MPAPWVPGLIISALVLSASQEVEKQRPSASEEIVVQASRPPEGYLVGWHEYRSEHFWVDSTLPNFIVSGLIEALEKLQALESRLVGPKVVALPGRIRVIAGSPGLLEDLAPDNYLLGSGEACRQLLNVPCIQIPLVDGCVESLRFRANYFVSRLGEPTIILPVAGETVSAEAVAHEIAHYLAAHLYLNPPAWMREGFAAYLQTLGGDPLQNTGFTGTRIQRGERFIPGAAGVPAPAFEHALCRQWISPKQLLRWRGDEITAQPGAFHTQSWLLYHWLRNARPKQLAAYGRRLAGGEDPAAAWRQAFPEFNPDRPGALESLDDALKRYFRAGGGEYFRTIAHPNLNYSEVPLSPTDVHALIIDARYSAYRSRGETPTWLDSELRRLLEEEPLQPVGLAWQAELQHRSATPGLLKATNRWPSDWRAWFLLGRAAVTAKDKESAYRRALNLNPESAVVLDELALVLARNGKPLEALSFAKRSLQLAPWDAHATGTLSSVYAVLGNCADALKFYERARHLSPPSPLEQVELDRSCTAGPRL